jgi:hypothetical protein
LISNLVGLFPSFLTISFFGKMVSPTKSKTA